MKDNGSQSLYGPPSGINEFEIAKQILIGSYRSGAPKITPEIMRYPLVTNYTVYNSPVLSVFNVLKQRIVKA